MSFFIVFVAVIATISRAVAGRPAPEYMLASMHHHNECNGPSYEYVLAYRTLEFHH